MSEHVSRVDTERAGYGGEGSEDTRVHPILINEGEIRFGSNVSLSSSGAPIKLVTKPRGVIALGDDISIGAGTTIAAFGRVEVGSSTSIGARCLLLGDESARGIRIGERVRIDDEVMIVAGAAIGDDARIVKGAVVNGVVAPGAVIEGRGDVAEPRSAIAQLADASDRDGDSPLLREVRETVSAILPSARVADASAPLQDWDSLTTVHLIVALEDRFGITIEDSGLIDRRTLQGLADFVDHRRATDAAPPPRKLAVVDGPTSDEAVLATPSETAARSPGRRSEGISLEIRALGGAFSKSNLFVKLANVLPIWALRHLRWQLLRAAGCKLSRRATFLGKVRFVGPSPANLEVGDGAVIGPNVTLGVDGKITIGRNVSVGPGVTIYTGTHDVGLSRRRMDPRVRALPVTIDDGAWIGLNALILPGVHIGSGAIVSAGAVVSSDVPSDAIVAGNPAVVTRTLNG